MVILVKETFLSAPIKTHDTLYSKRAQQSVFVVEWHNVRSDSGMPKEVPL